MKIVGGGGVTLHPQSSFTVKFLIHFQIRCPHKVKITNTKFIKICNQTKIEVMNANLGLEISYGAS